MLIKTLPAEALVRTPVEERGRAPWTAELELMAQLIEMTSVLAADRRIKKPVKVPRPNQPNKRRMRTTPAAREGRQAAPAGVSPYGAAIAALGGAQPSPKRSQLDPHDDDEEQQA